jgi:hypothetical protein
MARSRCRSTSALGVIANEHRACHKLRSQSPAVAPDLLWSGELIAFRAQRRVSRSVSKSANFVVPGRRLRRMVLYHSYRRPRLCPLSVAATAHRPGSLSPIGRPWFCWTPALRPCAIFASHGGNESNNLDGGCCGHIALDRYSVPWNAGRHAAMTPNHRLERTGMGKLPRNLLRTAAAQAVR